MSKRLEELEEVQENFMAILKIAIDKMNKKPIKKVQTLREVYLNQFVNINETVLRGIYDDRQRNLRKQQRGKTGL